MNRAKNKSNNSSVITLTSQKLNKFMSTSKWRLLLVVTKNFVIIRMSGMKSVLNSLKGFDHHTPLSKKLNLLTLHIVMTGKPGKAMEKQLSIWFPSKSTPALQTFQKFWKEHSRLCLKKKWKRKETFTRLKENIVMFLLNEWIELFYLRNILKN